MSLEEEQEGLRGVGALGPDRPWGLEGEAEVCEAGDQGRKSRPHGPGARAETDGGYG